MVGEFSKALIAAWTASHNCIAGIDPRISGILIGFFLSQGATLMRDWWTDRKQAKAVRKLLTLEIDHNLGVLLMLRDIFKPSLDEATPDDEPRIDIEVNSFLFDYAAGGFHRKAFETQVSLLTTALNEKQLADVYYFYSVISSVPVLFNVVKNEKTQDSLTWLIKYIEASIKRGNPLIDNGNLHINTKEAAKTEPTDKSSGTS